MNPPNSATANFDRIARAYRLLEYLTFGRSLQRCRTHYIPRLIDGSHALVLGDGDGRFLAALLAANPRLEAEAVDTSAAMLRLLTRRAETAIRNAAGCGHTDDATRRLRTYHSSALAFTPRRAYDLVATHFFLDCLTQPELDALCQRLAPHLAPQALWLVSDFRIPDGPMRWPARALVRALYLGFRVLTGLRTTALPSHAASLTAAGLRCIGRHRSLAGLLSTELWQSAGDSARIFMPSQEYTSPMLLPQRHSSHSIADPVPDPEPASPSLPGPDPGVFHPDPCDLPPTEPEMPPTGE
jgi:SAM-dependent methyltransferase